MDSGLEASRGNRPTAFCYVFTYTWQSLAEP